MSNLATRRYRAPQEDGAALIEPALDRVAEMLAENRRILAGHSCEMHGLRLPELAAIARQEFVAMAERYTTAYLSLNNSAGSRDFTHTSPLIVSGHQPELFHAGVWFKNFLLSSLAERHRATAINLIVDSDLARQTAIAVPKRCGGVTAIGSIPLDESAAAIPYEERNILNPQTFWSFPARVCEQLDAVAPRGNDCSSRIVTRLWDRARDIAPARSVLPPLGITLAQARHAVEGDAGLRTLEVPLSQVCQGQAFRRFVVYFLSDLPNLWGVYNDSLEAYRLANRVRSAAHPVPNLAKRELWLETPLHVWTRQNPIRRHCFARRTATGMELSNFDDVQVALDIAHDGAPDNALEQLAAAESRGIKLRPRALITTMFARLVLSDLFIHGIGGAKYDELTDEIIRRWLGIEPPKYLTASATFRLPLDRPTVTREEVWQSARRQRDARYRPESFLHHPLVTRDPALSRQLTALAAEKREYLERHTLRKARPDIYRGLAQIQQTMAACLEPVAAALAAEHARIVEQHARARRLGTREFAYALFQYDDLVPRLLELCKLSA